MSDSAREETEKHIKNVQFFMIKFANAILDRAAIHDKSKLESPEAPIFEKYTPLLKGLTYGSPEYHATLAEMKVALDHHYENNRHHPEWHDRGFLGMDLVDLIELIADWKSATLRHADGDIQKSLEINRDRFNIPSEIVEVLKNTIDNYMK